jgi:hypothetical protein
MSLEEEDRCLHCSDVGEIGKNGVAGNRTQNLLHSVMLEEQC